MTTTSVARSKPLTPAQIKLKQVNDRMERPNYQQSLRAVLPRWATPDAWNRTVVLAIAKNHKLLNCTEDSIAQAALQIAVWGLEIGRTAYIVPFGQEAAAQVDYKGMIELAIRGKSITSCRSEIVYARDDFQVERGLNEKLVHHFDWQADRGDPIGAYAIVRFPRGDQLFVLKSKREIEAHRDRYSQAWRRKQGERGPWETEPLEMWRKTCVRALLKYVPQNPLLAQVLAYDEDEVRQSDAEVLRSLEPTPSALSHGAVRHDHALEDGDLPQLAAGVETTATSMDPAGGGAEAEAPLAGPAREVMDMATKPKPQAPAPPDPYLTQGKRRRQSDQPEGAPREREPGEEDDDLEVDSRLAAEERKQTPRRR